MFRRGQGATELIVLLAMITIVGLVIYAISQNQLAESSKNLIVSQARASVNDLASASSEVYSEGVGAKRMVYVTIPEGADPSRVYVNNTIINIGVRLDTNVSDINTQTTMKLVEGADFPTTPGSYWIQVTAMQGYVLIGNSYLDISPQFISTEMYPSNVSSTVITFTNVGGSPLNVTLSPQWSNNGTVDLTLNSSSSSFVLDSTGNGVVAYLLVTLQTYSNTSLQPYSGKITVTTNASETDQINVNVNVVGSQLPSGVSYVVVETFRNSSYYNLTTNFTLPGLVTINGSNWAAGNVTVDIRNSSGSSMTGYPSWVTANSSGGFVYQWDPAGAFPGQYTVVANQSTSTSNVSFNVTVCPW